VSTVIDSQALELKNSVDKFYADIQQIKSGQALAVFYYADHAIQIEYHNYLVPLNMQFSSSQSFMAGLFDINTLFSATCQHAKYYHSRCMSPQSLCNVALGEKNPSQLVWLHLKPPQEH
jgi:hypothetical protein